MKVPVKPWSLLLKIRKDILPESRRFLSEWEKKARDIPDSELRKQALSSIREKAFHCEGGAVYGLLAGQNLSSIVRFIVAYQTISDYLDNLCDRSTSFEEQDFRLLHQSMLHALSPGAEPVNYYRHHPNQEDGGYLASLVLTCQDILKELPGFQSARAFMQELAQHYCDLQVFKHVETNRRALLLENWFARKRDTVPPMSWYEFSACTGSTLGIFCLAAYASSPLTEEEAAGIKNGYFPWIQGLHIMLDYFIDQEEDRKENELNFVFFYESEEQMVQRIRYFKEKAGLSIRHLPHSKFHGLICKGLIALYLADKKVQEDRKLKRTARQFLRFGGLPAFFFYLNRRVYRQT